ncbi:MAG: hypothetical protein DHS20C11_00640 [Lysobacteraceae bacterium]|nr:MAG: hypothetical protein DHS20C11_00640 [Xanthomonadaceae bacterium]
MLAARRNNALFRVTIDRKSPAVRPTFKLAKGPSLTPPKRVELTALTLAGAGQSGVISIAFGQQLQQ